MRRIPWRLVGLAAICAGHVALTLAVAPGWIFAKYPGLADSLRRGALSAAQASDASPAYLLLNVALGPEALRLVQALAAAATIAGVAALVARARGPVLAGAAALALALAQSWLLYSAVLEPDLLLGALEVLALVALGLGSRERRRAGALAGGALGLATALRPTAALFAAAALAWLVLDRRRASAAGGHALAYVAALVAGAAAPAALLCALARPDLRTTMSAGQVLHAGHRPGDAGVGAHAPPLLKLLEAHLAAGPDHRPDQAHELYRRLASDAAGTPMPAVAAEAYWLRQVGAFALHEPEAFAEQLLRKAVFIVVAPAPGADVAGVTAVVQEHPRFPWLPPEALALAGVGGLLFAVRGRRLDRLVGLFAATQALVALLFFYQHRYGVPLAPAWCCLGACAAEAVWSARRAPRRLALRLAVVAAPAALFLPGFVRAERRLEERRLLVPVASPIAELRAAGRRAEALDHFLDEQASFPDVAWPWSPRGWGLGAGAADTAQRAAARARARFGTDDPVDAFLVALLDAQGERCDLALPLADRAAAAGVHGTVDDTELALDPDLLASDCLLERGQPRRAYERVLRSLSRWPGTLDGLARAAAAQAAHPGYRGGAGALRLLFALHDPASAHFALARARRLWRDPAGALADAAALAALVPEAAPLADFERALALLDLGRTPEALDAYARTFAIRFYPYGASRFDGPIRALTAARPDDADAARLALRHWMRQGDDDEVRAALARLPDASH